MTLDINQNEYNGVLSDAYGIRLSVNAPGELNYPQSDGITIPSGESIQINLK